MWKCEEWEKKNKKNNNTYSWNDFYGELVNQIFSLPEKREFSILSSVCLQEHTLKWVCQFPKSNLLPAVPLRSSEEHNTRSVFKQGYTKNKETW